MGKEVVFLTGSTGFLGSYLLKILLENNHKVYCLARGKKKTAYQRVVESLSFWDKEIGGDKLKNLRVIEGDIILSDLGIKSQKEKDELFSEIEIIFHCAALARLRVELERIRRINVEGVKNILEFALRCKRIRRVNHISTAYVVGKKEKIEFSEDMLELNQDFNNTYEQSKYEAEILVKEFRQKGLKISVFRPSLVMGDSYEGKTTEFRLFYEPLHFFSNEIYKEFPVNESCFQNVINVDTVAKAIFLLKNEEGTFHIVSPNHINIGFFIRLASQYFGFSPPELIPPEKFNFKKWTPVQRLLAEPYIPYFNFTVKFLSEKTQEILKNRYNFEIPQVTEDNLIKVFEYCVKRGFIRQKVKTVWKY